MRVVLYKINSNSKVVKDYLTRKEATAAYFDLCDSKGCNYGKPTFKYVNSKKVQDGVETSSNDFKINLYF